MLAPKLIVSPIDFSEPSLQALDTAADLAVRYQADLLLIHAVPVIAKLPADVSIFKEHDYERELIRDAQSRLDELAKDLTKKGVRARTQVGLANDAAMEVIRAAEDAHADLIVIATHGMTGWRRLAFGSVTEKIVRTASCPVLVLRQQAHAAEQAHPASAAAS